MTISKQRRESFYAKSLDGSFGGLRSARVIERSTSLHEHTINIRCGMVAVREVITQKHDVFLDSSRRPSVLFDNRYTETCLTLGCDDVGRRLLVCLPLSIPARGSANAQPFCAACQKDQVSGITVDSELSRSSACLGRVQLKRCKTVVDNLSTHLLGTFIGPVNSPDLAKPAVASY